MSGHFESGVARYVHAVAVVDVFFPVDFKGSEHCYCTQCKYFQSQSRKCGLTHEVSEFPERYVGSHCPLQFYDDNENNNNFESEDISK
jgi:hypothetical protein